MIYVGKAKSLRSRVRHYFQKGGDGRAQIGAARRARVADVEVIVTGTEVEALHLEQNLIKRHRPSFNVRLRDDKSFPYIAVTVEDEYPARDVHPRAAPAAASSYFGPYANAKKVRETLDVLNRVFPYRPCEGPKPGRHSGIPCLDYHIDRCLAPCVGYVSKEDYRAMIDGVIEFLSGDVKPIQRELERRMQRGRGGRALRGGGALPQPSVRRPAPRRAAGAPTGARRHGGRARLRGRRRPRRRAGLPAPRRQDGRPLRVPSRERRRPGRRRRSSRRSASSTTARAERAAAARRAARLRRPLARSRSSSRSGAARASRSARPSAARSAGCRSSRRERAARARHRARAERSRSGCAGSRRSRSCARR